jgi:hypothetical protein
VHFHFVVYQPWWSATMLTAFKAAPTRIAFHTIPQMF